MKRLIQINTEFWTQDRSLTALLLYLVVNIFVLLPFSSEGLWELVVNDVAFSLILISGVFAVSPRYSIKVLMVVSALGAFLLRWLVLVQPTLGLRLADLLSTIFFLLLLALIVLRQVFKEGHITLYRIMGAVAVYLIVGLAFANVYQFIFLIRDGAFAFSSGFADSEVFFSRFLYFSFVTLTTLGYGDITPLHPAAKSLVMLQGIVGMLFPAIMITRLVGLEIESRKARMKP
jgi:hypothetical protein